MTKDQTVRFNLVFSDLLHPKVVNPFEIVPDLWGSGYDFPDTGLSVDGQDDIPIHLPDVPPFEEPRFTDTDSGVRQDQDVVDQHRPFPKGLLVYDLHEFPEVTDDLPPLPFIKVGSSGLFTVDPGELGEFLEVSLLHTPSEEMSKIVLDPLEGVGGHRPSLGPLSEIVGQFRDCRGRQVLECLGLEVVLHPLEEEDPVFDRQPIVGFEPFGVGIDPYGDLGPLGLNLTTQNLDQLTMVEVISEFVGLMFVRCPGGPIDVPGHSRNLDPTEPDRGFVVPSEEQIYPTVPEGFRFQDVLSLTTFNVRGGVSDRCGIVVTRFSQNPSPNPDIRIRSVYGLFPDFWEQGSSKPLKTGAGEGIRTLDPNLGKVVLYP